MHHTSHMQFMTTFQCPQGCINHISTVFSGPFQGYKYPSPEPWNHVISHSKNNNSPIYSHRSIHRLGINMFRRRKETEYENDCHDENGDRITIRSKPAHTPACRGKGWLRQRHLGADEHRRWIWYMMIAGRLYRGTLWRWRLPWNQCLWGQGGRLWWGWRRGRSGDHESPVDLIQ